MTPEEHRILMETRELAEENARVLRGVQRSLRASMAFKIGYWLLIIGLSVGAFWFIQPYVNTLKGSMSGLTGLN